MGGVALDPVSFLLQGLASRFAPLDEETRRRAASDLLNFTRRQNENVDTLITRFELTRFRARQDGGGTQLSTEMRELDTEGKKGAQCKKDKLPKSGVGDLRKPKATRKPMPIKSTRHRPSVAAHQRPPRRLAPTTTSDPSHHAAKKTSSLLSTRRTSP